MGMTSLPFPAYRGKEGDSINSVVRMSVRTTDGNPLLHHIWCATSRPFARRYPIGEPPSWLAPYCDPWRGLNLAMQALGLVTRRWVVTGNRNAVIDQLNETVRGWIHDGPIILGPLDTTNLWNELRRHFYGGDSHFVLILGVDASGFLSVHDPNGCPYLRLSNRQATDAILGYEGSTGLLQVLDRDSASNGRVLKRIMTVGAEINFEAAELDSSGSKGLVALASTVSEAGLTSSQAASLHYGIPGLILSTHALAELADEEKWLETLGADWRETSRRWLELCQSMRLACAAALSALLGRDSQKVTTALLGISNLENQLTKLYADILSGYDLTADA